MVFRNRKRQSQGSLFAKQNVKRYQNPSAILKKTLDERIKNTTDAPVSKSIIKSILKDAPKPNIVKEINGDKYSREQLYDMTDDSGNKTTEHFKDITNTNTIIVDNEDVSEKTEGQLPVEQSLIDSRAKTVNVVSKKINKLNLQGKGHSDKVARMIAKRVDEMAKLTQLMKYQSSHIPPQITEIVNVERELKLNETKDMAMKKIKKRMKMNKRQMRELRNLK